MKKRYILLGVLILLLIFGYFLLLDKNKESGFEVDTFVLKYVIKEGESITQTLKITNYDSRNFHAEVYGFDGLFSLSEDDFILEYNEKKNLNLNINIENAKPGIYIGSLLIESDINTREIPIIIEIQTRDVLFAINLDVSPEYREIQRNSKFSASVRIFNLMNSNTNEVKTNYAIKKFNSDVIFSESEMIVVGTDSTITKTFFIPKEIETGNYVFVVTTEAEDTLGTSSYIFTVVDKKSNILENTDSFTIFFSIIILLFLFGIILIVFFIIKDRNKLYLELERQHNDELNRCMKRVEEEKRDYLERASAKHKEKIVRVFVKLKNKVTHELKKKHKKEKIEFTKLRKYKKKDELQKRMEEWKKQGYDTDMIISNSKPKSMNKQLMEWKKQGYKTNFLKK